MNDTILLIAVIILTLAIPFAFILGYATREWTAQQEQKRMNPILDMHLGLTAKRLNYDRTPITTAPHAQVQNTIDNPSGEKQPPVVIPTGPDLFRRREEAFIKEEKEWKAKQQGMNGMPPMS